MAKGLLIRIIEHAEWVPVFNLPDEPQVLLAQEHIFGLEMEDGERLQNLNVVQTPLERTVPAGIGNGKGKIRVRLYACQAVLVAEDVNLDDLQRKIDEAPAPETDDQADRREARKRIHLPPGSQR